MIKIDDFVVLKVQMGDLVPNSIGIVKNVDADSINVFFIGKRLEIQTSLKNLTFLDITKTGKPYEFKICNVCHILKRDSDDFDINQTDAKGRKTTRPSCKSCRVEIDGVALKTEEKRRLDKTKAFLYLSNLRKRLNP